MSYNGGHKSKYAKTFKVGQFVRVWASFGRIALYKWQRPITVPVGANVMIISVYQGINFWWPDANGVLVKLCQDPSYFEHIETQVENVI